MMTTLAGTDCQLALKFARRIRESRAQLVDAWLERIAKRAAAPPSQTPTARMIEIMPVIVEGIAWYLEHPEETLAPDSEVLVRASELGTLRRDQGFDANQILAEYALLAEALFEFLAERLDDETAGGELLLCGHALFRAITRIEMATTARFLQLWRERAEEREERLRTFNRAVTHEIRNRIGAVISAGELLALDTETARAKRLEFADIIMRNAEEM